MTTTISIIGSALSGNKGAAAMLEAAVDGLSARVPDASFVLFSMYPDEDRKLNVYGNLEIIDASPLKLGVVINSLALAYKIIPPIRGILRRRSKAIRALAASRIFLDQGGITFADGREKFLIYNLASILPALFVGVPVVKCAQAIGPFKGGLNRLVSRIFLPRMKRIVTRGRITHSYAEDLGLKNILAGADLAFTLPAVVSQERKSQGDESVGRVAISPSVVIQKKIDASGRNYRREVAELIEYCVSRGRKVVLFPHSARPETSATHNNDLPLCREISALLEPAVADQIEFHDKEYASQDLRKLIAGCDVLVTSRFHAMVSGLATATPTLVIGWSHKYQEVLEMVGSERWAVPHQNSSVPEVKEHFEELWAARDEVSQTIAANLPAVREKANQQLELIAQDCRETT